jgi:hypothetical protein
MQDLEKNNRLKMAHHYTFHKPILITGAHRSGTTWVGRTLALSKSIGYIEEPFSPAVRNYHPGICNAKFDHWWMYITRENEEKYVNEIVDTLNFRYQVGAQIKRIVKNKFGFRTSVKGYVNSFNQRFITKSRPLLKDPIALFSTQWLAEKFNMDVVILIRHPAAFVSSVKRMEWPHDFSNFLNQPLLIRDHLGAFEKDIKAHMSQKTDIISDAILLWRMFHYFILKLRNSNQNFIYIKHEKLSLDPVDGFKSLFAKLNIEFTNKIEKFIVNSTNSANPSEAPTGVMHQLKRNSKENIDNWKKRLTDTEIERIKEGVEDVSKFFYDETDWL